VLSAQLAVFWRGLATNALMLFTTQACSPGQPCGVPQHMHRLLSSSGAAITHTRIDSTVTHTHLDQQLLQFCQHPVLTEPHYVHLPVLQTCIPAAAAALGPIATRCAAGNLRTGGGCGCCCTAASPCWTAAGYTVPQRVRALLVVLRICRAPTACAAAGWLLCCCCRDVSNAQQRQQEGCCWALHTCHETRPPCTAQGPAVARSMLDVVLFTAGDLRRLAANCRRQPAEEAWGPDMHAVLTALRQ
jgi:hypothetical protein